MGLNLKKDYLYLNASNGALRNKKENIEAMSYTGKLLSIIQTTDMFEEQVVPKIELKVKDLSSEQVASIKFNEASWFSFGFFARIDKIDVSLPIEIGASGQKENEKVTYCWLKQSNKPLEKSIDACFNAKKITVSCKPANDWGELVKVIPGLVKILQDKLNQQNDWPTTNNTPQPDTKSDNDDLPF